MRARQAEAALGLMAAWLTSGLADWLDRLLAPLPPLRRVHHFLDALRQSVAQHAQSIDRDTRWLQQIALANIGGIDAELCGNLIQRRFEGEAHVNRAVAAHRATCRLIGEHAVAVV